MAVRASRSPTDVCGWGGKRGEKNGGERREEKRSRNDEEKGRKARKEKTARAERRKRGGEPRHRHLWTPERLTGERVSQRRCGGKKRDREGESCPPCQVLMPISCSAADGRLVA